MITQNDLKNAHPKKDREDLSLLPIREATITYLERVSISEYNQTWDENFTYDPFSYSYNTRNTKFYVLKRKKIYFGVLESLDNYTATYVFLLLSENEFENQIQIIKNDIRDIYTTRNGIKNKFYINNNKIDTYSWKDKPYDLGNISHVNFHYWHKKLHDIIMPIAKQMSNRRFRFGGLRRSKISVLYNKSLSQISNILNIETSLLIKLLKRKSPYLNITESYIMSDYEAEIYKDFFIKLLRKKTNKGNTSPL